MKSDARIARLFEGPCRRCGHVLHEGDEYHIIGQEIECISCVEATFAALEKNYGEANGPDQSNATTPTD